MIKNKYLIYILIAPFLFLSCTDSNIVGEFNDGKTDNNKIVLTPDEFVSIAYDNPQELPQEAISNIVLNFRDNIEIGNEISTRSSEPAKVSIAKKYYITEKKNSIETLTATRSPISDKFAIPIFEVEIDNNKGNKSLAVVCGDERVPEVLFYLDNYIPKSVIDNGTRYLLELSKKNVFSDIQQIEHIKSTKKDSTLRKIAQQLNIPQKKISYLDIKDRIITTDEISTRNNNPGNQAGGVSRPQSYVVGYVNPLSKVAWKQGEPYNYGRPIMMIYDGYGGEQEGNLAVGCANVAIGILFSILKPSMSLNNNLQIDWDYITSVESITFIPEIPGYGSPEDMVNMITGLLAQIAIDTKSFPSYEDKKLTDVNTGNKYTKSVITGTGTSPSDITNYLRNIVNFSGNENNKFNGNLAKQSLFERKPVFLQGSGHMVDANGDIIGKAGGHAWLIDGVVITKRQRRAGYDHYWSVNMGWGEWSRAYFRTSNDLQDCDIVFKTDDGDIAYYTQEMTMLYNITKK